MLQLGSLERYSHGDAHEKREKKNPSSYCRECAGQKTPILADILIFFFLFKVDNQTLRKLGDNDFRVEHTGVGKRQRDGTLKRWQYMTRKPLARRETTQRSVTRRTSLVCFCLFLCFFVSGTGSKNGLLQADWILFGRWYMQEAAQKKNSKTRTEFNAKK